MARVATGQSPPNKTPLGTKTFQRVSKINLQIGWLPVFPIRFGRKTGNLAGHIWQCRNRFYIRRPGLRSFATNVGLAQVIQYERDLGNAARQFGHTSQLFVPRTHTSKVKTKFGKKLHSGDEFSLQDKLRAFTLQISPDSLHQRTSGDGDP